MSPSSYHTAVPRGVVQGGEGHVAEVQDARDNAVHGLDNLLLEAEGGEAVGEAVVLVGVALVVDEGAALVDVVEGGAAQFRHRGIPPRVQALESG